MPVLTLLELIVLWFGVSLPLTFAGAYFGNKGEVTHAHLFHHTPSNGLSPRRLDC
jgi:hypothetical protein